MCLRLLRDPQLRREIEKRSIDFIARQYRTLHDHDQSSALIKLSRAMQKIRNFLYSKQEQGAKEINVDNNMTEETNKYFKSYHPKIIYSSLPYRNINHLLTLIFTLRYVSYLKVIS